MESEPLLNSSLELSKKNHGDHGEKSGKGFMGEKFSIPYNQAYPCDLRGWVSSESDSRLGFTWLEAECLAIPGSRSPLREPKLGRIGNPKGQRRHGKTTRRL
jgi:hypothetical protein